MQRRADFRPFSWLNDLWKREQLDLDPPYQRRSVWSNRYRQDFITTVLLNYPCPAIFLFEVIKPDGSFLYKVVDGKQRISTLIDFVKGDLQISADYPIEDLREKFFSELIDERKLSVWRYSFAVEFIEQENEAIINDIFNRINKNVAKLTSQELRHARFSGLFITSCEILSNYTEKKLSADFPRVAAQSRRQMKDVENTASLLLFLEQGERAMSQLDLDRAFSQRDEEWDYKDAREDEFKQDITFIQGVMAQDDGHIIKVSRLRNQADFYSLFSAIAELTGEGNLPTTHTARTRLLGFVRDLAVENPGNLSIDDSNYLSAARSASNDAGPRRTRINRIKEVLLGP